MSFGLAFAMFIRNMEQYRKYRKALGEFLNIDPDGTFLLEKADPYAIFQM